MATGSPRRSRSWKAADLLEGEASVITPAAVGVSDKDEDGDERWILDELGRAGRIRKSQIIERTGWSDSKARRVLGRLRDGGRVVFEGSARGGYWRLA